MSTAISRQKSHIRKAERELSIINDRIAMVEELEDRRALEPHEDTYRAKLIQKRWDCQQRIARMKTTLFILENESK